MPFKIIDGYKVGFYSLDRGEPPHMHVLRGDNEAKIWLVPVEVEWNEGYNTRELNRIVGLINEHQQELLEMWNDHFSQ
ncbi:MAG: DUF4160 domain-containing protein [Bacteroidota bacterium]